MNQLGAQRIGRKKLAWISAEVREEIEELIVMVGTVADRFDVVRIDAPRAVLESMPLPASVGACRLVPAPYRHAIGRSPLRKITGLIQFSWRLLRWRPYILISGFSMLKHRTVSRVLHVPHLAYIRGVTLDADITGGWSDRLRLGWAGNFLPSRVVQAYGADIVLTVGPTNVRFLEARGIQPHAIRVVGPLWLSSVMQLREKKLSDPSNVSLANRAFFVTDAWAAHGKAAEHEGQLALTRQLAREWDRPEKFALRVHPRDFYPYEADPAFAGVTLNRDTPADFLASLCPGDVIIAPLSTLAFEALYVGIGVIFYSDPKATLSYNHVYDRLGIKPFSAADILAGCVEEVRGKPDRVFGPIDVRQFRRAVRDLDHRSDNQ